LRRKILQQRDLLVRERTRFTPADRKGADGNAVLNQSDQYKCSNALAFDACLSQWIAGLVKVVLADVDDVDHTCPPITWRISQAGSTSGRLCS
jgi:hypothetical protein